MFKEIFSFELRLGLKRAATYIYFSVLAAVTLMMGLAASGFFDTTRIDTNTIANSAYAVSGTILSLSSGLFILMLSSLIISTMGTAIQKDYQYETHPLFFTKPISKAGYFFGRFTASFLLILFVFSGLVLGYWAGTLYGIGTPAIGQMKVVNYLEPVILFLIPNLLFTGILLFSVTTYLRNTMAAYIVVILLVVFQSVSGLLFSDIDNQLTGAILDPSGSRALAEVTQYWSPAEKNENLIPFKGALMYNRLLWLGLSLLIGAVSYYKFSFSQFLAPLVFFGGKRKADGGKAPLVHSLADMPAVTTDYSARAARKQLFRLGLIEFRTILRSAFYIIMTLLGALLLVTGVIFADRMDESPTYPVTYKLVSMASGEVSTFVVLFLIFYSGTLIWRERDRKMDELIGVTPVSNGILFFSKFIGLALACLLMYVMASLLAISIQLGYGFYDIDLSQYAVSVFTDMLVIAVFIAAALSFQAFSKNKYVGYFGILVLVLILPITFAILEWNGVLYDFNSEGYTKAYSDMNGYGGSFVQWPYFRLYWYSISAFLCFVALILYPRGKEMGWGKRWRLSRYFNTRGYRLSMMIPLFMAAGSGGFIYYQENVVKDSKSAKEYEKDAAALEKRFKKYARLPMPRIVEVKVNLDIFPESGEMHVAGMYILKNKTSFPIDTLYVDYPGGKTSGYKVKLVPDVPHQSILNDADHGIAMMKLARSLNPGDSMGLRFDISYRPVSHYWSASSPVAGNGTFLSNTIFPTIGYNESAELSMNEARKEYGLPPRPRMAAVDDSAALMNTYISKDADWIRFEATLSTREGQLAVAPGYLQKEWKQGGRHYFQYKMDSPILNFYSFLSAAYSVKKDRWKDVNIEIYYQKGHEFNLDRMIRSIKKSLDYYTEHFGPYQHRQIRIMEFPRYASFAQSFPNTIPFSESIGFIMKVEEDPEKIDLPFYVTAHEVAHQWWAHQVIGGDVQGSPLMSETMSQYGALMVMEKEYGRDAMRKFLKMEMDNYLKSRAFEYKGELPLMLCENQQYIHYNKGSVVMYALRDFLGEERLNGALRAYLEKTKFAGPPYTNSVEFVSYLRQAAPDSLQYLITDMFERITLYENYVKALDYRKMPDGSYKVSLTAGSAKFYADSLGNLKKYPVSDYMDIGVFAADSAGRHRTERPLLMQRVKMDKQEKVFEFLLKEKPYSAGVDPYLKLIDRTPANNNCLFGEKPAKPELKEGSDGFEFIFRTGN